MSDFVVDSNVWVQVDKSPGDCKTEKELSCLKVSRDWLRVFVDGDDKLAVDSTYRILLEYREQIRRYAPNGLARQWLNRLETKPRDRKLVEVDIEFDADGYAIIPDGLFDDEDDRKFIAVALMFDPPCPIANATDTDWEENKTKLLEAMITVVELCPDYIQAKLKT